MATGNKIVVSGAREHNLKDISLELPRDALVVITGLSGSGKSSLAFDTVYAEGQRRYVESLSAYARQFLGQMDKPDVDSIEGLSPAISIDQKTTSRNPRSTVGTVTEIYDYLRLLWARIGHPHCPNCGRPIAAQSAEQIIDQVMTLPDGTRFMVLAPVVRGRKGEYGKLLDELRADGYTRVKVDGELRRLEEVAILPWSTSASNYYDQMTQAIADRYEIDMDTPWYDLPENVQDCFLYGTNGDRLYISYRNRFGRRRSYTTTFEGIVPNLERRYRETDSDYSREKIEEYMSVRPCPECDGARLRPESLAVRVAGRGVHEVTRMSAHRAIEWFERLELTETERQIARLVLREIDERLRFLDNVGVGYLSLERAAGTLSGGEAQRIRLATQIGSSLVGVLYILDEPSIGLHQRDNARLIATLERLRDIGNTVVVVEHDEEMMRRSDWLVDMGPGAGLHGGDVVAEGPAAKVARNRKSVTGQFLSRNRTIAIPERRYDDYGSFVVRNASQHNLKGIDVYVPCETCKGARYNRETLEVRFKGRNISEVLDMSVEEALQFFAKIPKIRRRLQTLHDVGLDYIKLGQPATTLSGGEAQRVKLAAELCKVATGKTLYILDEPTTGLHFADIEKLLETLQRLVDAGNTMIVIEHNLDVIKQADWIVDLGPEGGEAGGEIVAVGTPEDVADDRPLAGVQRPSDRVHPASANGSEEVRLRLDRRGAARRLGQVEESAQSAGRVGEAHQCAPVHHPAGRALPFVPGEPASYL